MYYLIRRDNNFSFTVTKWDDGTMPIRDYKVWYDKKNQLQCNCPSGRYRGYCRHKDYVKNFVAMGEPEGLEFT